MLKLLTSWLENPARGNKCIGYINPHVFNMSMNMPVVNRFLSACDLVCIDGIGISAGLRWVFGVRVCRVVAEEMFNAALNQPAIVGNALLIGIESEHVQRAAVGLNQLPSGIRIIATLDGFQEGSDYTEFFKLHPDADIVLIGAGTPKSERIAQLARVHCSNTLCWHIGAGTIKTWAGTKKRAPLWVSKLGIQWLHRIVFEPHTRSRYCSGAWRFFRTFRAVKLEAVHQINLEETG